MNARRWLFSLLAAVGMLAVGGCNGEEIKWTEEVQLHDGRVIELKRRIDLTATGFPVQKRGIPKHYEFCYAPMKMYWRMRRAYQPDIFDIVGGKAYLHVPITGCFQCKLHGFPPDNALAFVWENEAWRQIPYETFPAQPHWNLLQDAEGADTKYAASGHVTLAQKYKLDFGNYYAQKHQGWTRLNQAKTHIEPCETCSRNIQTTDTSDVFLATESKSCD